MKDYTVIYSENCIEACKRLIDEFILTFNVTGVHSDDLFYYGVFCKDITYANFRGWDDAPDDLEIPEIFKNPCATHTSREEYVRDIINQILLGEISKPAWMIYVEMETSVDEYDQAPSTFLYLMPKNPKYTNLANRLIEFLYSPNMIIRIVEC